MDKSVMNLESLEKVMMEGMRLSREKTVSKFGIAKALPDKDESNPASQAVTEIDLYNQEIFLEHLFRKFPNVEISVEERVDNPTGVQERFYSNGGKSNLCVTLDALDGSYSYKHGIRNDYGIIGSVIKRKEGQIGEFISGIMYFPTDDFFFLANNKGLFEIKGDNKTKLEKKGIINNKRQEYSAVFAHEPKRLGVEAGMYIRDIYSINQMLLQLVKGEIPGFLTSNGHVYDHLVGPWMASKWGADVSYASREPFDSVPFGDKLIDGKRKPPRDNRGLLIVGDKNHLMFNEYMRK
jgi:fructose-1,6-bisphosphatase/inositol monophosphatase family enzyme